MKYLSTLGYIFIFLCLFFISFIVLHKQAGFTGPKNPNIIDHYATDVTVTDYDLDGNVKSILTADTVTHYKESGETLLKNPYLKTIAGQNNLIWHIKSDTATVNKTGDQAILVGHVILHQPSLPDHPEVKITTTEMTVFLKKSYAKTMQPVTITRPGSVIHGIGMTADMKTGEYQILSQPHATIDLEKQPKTTPHHKKGSS